MTTQEWKDLPDLQWVATAQAEGWEIELFAFNEWGKWDRKSWNENWKFRARPRQPKVVTKKLCAWVGKNDGSLIYHFGSVALSSNWTRQPKLDLEAEFTE